MATHSLEQLAQHIEESLWSHANYTAAKRDAQTLLTELHASDDARVAAEAIHLELRATRALAVIARDRSDPTGDQLFADALRLAERLRDRQMLATLVSERVTARLNRGAMFGAARDLQTLKSLLPSSGSAVRDGRRKFAALLQWLGSLEEAHDMHSSILAEEEEPSWRATTLIHRGRNHVFRSETAQLSRERLRHLRLGFADLERASNILAETGHRVWSMTASTAWTRACLAAGDVESALREHESARRALTQMSIRNHWFEDNEQLLPRGLVMETRGVSLAWARRFDVGRRDPEAAYKHLVVGLEAALESIASMGGRATRKAPSGFMACYDHAAQALVILEPPVDIETMLRREDAKQIANLRNDLSHESVRSVNVRGLTARLEGVLARFEQLLPDGILRTLE